MKKLCLKGKCRVSLLYALKECIHAAANSCPMVKHLKRSDVSSLFTVVLFIYRNNNTNTAHLLRIK